MTTLSASIRNKRRQQNQRFPSFQIFRFAAGLGGIPPRPSEYKKRTAPPPCSFRTEPSKKAFFSFYLPAEDSAQAGKKKSGARISEKQGTFFFGVRRVREVVAGRPHSLGFSAKWVLTFSNKHHKFMYGVADPPTTGGRV